jgi:hypothetical protein
MPAAAKSAAVTSVDVGVNTVRGRPQLAVLVRTIGPVVAEATAGATTSASTSPVATANAEHKRLIEINFPLQGRENRRSLQATGNGFW